MHTRTSRFSVRRALAGTLATLITIATVASLAMLATAPLLADDRDILRETTTKPYLFVILDTSGSMNWSPKCSAEDFAAGICNFLCPTGDCAVPRDGDDPASKFRQAKEALYEVLTTVEDIDLGFGTYNSDDLGVQNKHWLYKVSATQPAGFFSLAGSVPFPIAGSDEVFGSDWWNSNQATCAYGTGDANIGCLPRRSDGTAGTCGTVCNPADTNSSWEYARFRRLPRLDSTANQTTYLYLRVPDSTRYRIRYSGSVTFGAAQISVPVQVARCTNSTCSTVDSAVSKTINYDRVGDFVRWDFTINRTNPQMGFLGTVFGTGQDSISGNTCDGWDPNDDPIADRYNDSQSQSNLKQVTGPAAPDNNPGPFFDPGNADIWRFQYGDVIPLAWTTDNKLAVLNRLAPRLNGGAPASDPEAFADATYLADTQVSGENYLRPLDPTRKPLIPSGSTPLRNSIASFRSWYTGCDDTRDGNGDSQCSTEEGDWIGWEDYAADHDSNWSCRKKYLLVLTDGDDTCPSSSNLCRAGELTGALFNWDEVRTYVVGYGVDSGSSNQLTCMAVNGGTVAPIYPQNKQQLIDALTAALSEIREEASAFASAAVPQVQANVTDKIFLSSFTPVADAGFWAGRMDAFLKPLPIHPVTKEPDRSVLCSSTVKARCFLWDAGDVQPGLRSGVGGGSYTPQGFLLQAPHPTDVDAIPPFDASQLQLGTAADERRVVYSQFSALGNRRLFTYPVTAAEKYDLWTGMNIGFIVGNAASETAAENQANAVLTKVLLEKEATVGTDVVSQVTYLLGDIFHADPVVVNKPNNFTYYTSDPYLNRALCGAASPDPGRFPPTSYRWFADRHACRRSLLLAGANDGQLHAFDAGIFRDPASGSAECLLPAKDLDGNGTASVDEYSDGVVDYDLGDDIESESENKHILDGAYDNGNGREVFSFIPRPMLKTLVTAVEGQDRNAGFWGIDASPRVDDVFIDPQASEIGSVTCTAREWRSVVLGGYREGGPGYYALDITQPDSLDGDHVPQPAAGYTPSCFNGGGDCGVAPYPAVLWEFQDRQLVTILGVPTDLELDEDLNGVRDLGNSWSKMTTGRIRVCTGSCADEEIEDRFVAIFGGGVGDDPATATGNFIYMVDVETGKVIYKKDVIGAVPSDIAAIDANGDSFIDRLYFGTTAGLVYKVQFDTAATPMKLESQTFQTRNPANGLTYDFNAIRLNGPAIEPARYDPFSIFSTGGRPLYQEVAAIYLVTQGRVALAFGTGNRWNLWDFDNVEGRFYVLLDDNFVDPDHDGVIDITCGGCTEPLTESSYLAVAPDAANGTSLLLYEGDGAGSLPGWYLTLEPNEKVITEAFSFAGVTIFTSFRADEIANDGGTCSRLGASHIFIVDTVRASGYAEGFARYMTVGDLTTPPFVEQGATKNPEGTPGTTNHADFITDELASIRDALKALQLPRCRYANYTLNIKTIRSDTGVEFVAPVPVCIDPTNWKEF